MKNENGIGFSSLLGLTFIILKLCGVINWSWWIVLLPLYWWLPVVLLMLVVWINRKRQQVEQDAPKNNPPKRSKFQERLEEMQKQRDNYSLKNK